MRNNFLKNRNKRFAGFLLINLILISVLFWSFPASACGCGLMISQSDDGWSYGDDSAEQSFINFENGTEKLIITLNLKKRSKDAVLVIPIPANPKLIKADVLSDVPKFSGYNVSKKAHENLSSIRDALLSTQIYPIVPILLKSSISTSYVGGANSSDGALLNAPTKGINQDIVVYQHLEKEGMVAEVLSAATSDALYDYLKQKGLKVEKDSIPIFRDYINKEFSFVVSWISPSASADSAKGLQMNFPAKKIFYPLKPGSAYPGDGMEKIINVVGFVSPKLYPDIKNATKADYFYSEIPSSFKDFSSSGKKFGFTRIIVKAAPKKLTQDLYISNNAPLKITNAQLINFHPFIYGLILLIVFSFISTYLALRFSFIRTTRVSINMAKLGVFSCFTLIGAIIGSFVFLKEKRFKFIVSFSLIFVAITLIILFLISLLYK